MPDTLDVLTLDEAKRAVNLSENRPGHEEQLQQAVTAVSRLLDDLCNPVVVRTITDETHYAAGSDVIFPKHTPVSTVTTVTEYQSGTGTVLTAEDFDTAGTYLLRNNMIFRRSGWAAVRFDGIVKVTYVAGRYATTATVDAKFKRAASEILQGNWSKYAAAWARGGDVFTEPAFFDEVNQLLGRWLRHERKIPTAV